MKIELEGNEHVVMLHTCLTEYEKIVGNPSLKERALALRSILVKLGWRFE